MTHLGTIIPGSTVYIGWDTVNGAGASITQTTLATSDIEIIKDNGTAARGSDSGYTLLDTDGTDIASITGIHGVSVDLADNTTAGFYAAGSFYRVIIQTITVDGQTVSFTAATFYIGYPGAILNTTISGAPTATSLVLASGPAEADALNGCLCLIHDVASAVQMGWAVIQDYAVTSKTVTLAAATTFTIADTDNVSVFPPSNIMAVRSSILTGSGTGADPWGP